MIKYNYNLLTDRIKNKFKNISSFGRSLGISEKELLLKLENKIEFEQSEIVKTCDILEIEEKDIKIYFFEH